MTEYMYGNPFENFADVLTHCDDSDSRHSVMMVRAAITYITLRLCRGGSEKMSPGSLDEVHDRIVAAVQKVTDMKREEILWLINDDLFVVGCG